MKWWKIKEEAVSYRSSKNASNIKWETVITGQIKLYEDA